MLNFKAKKSLGQNFLKSEKALEQIIDVAEIKKEDVILEIGPGKGALTEKILEKAGKVIAIEKDGRSVEFLKEKFAKEIANNKLEILEEDILNFNEGDPHHVRRGGDDGGAGYKIIANIPYYITGEILRKFLSSKNQPSSMTVLVQKEVADRICARDKKESILSVSVKIFGSPKYVATVKKESFSPSPKVDSAILHISDISKDRLRDPRHVRRGGDEGVLSEEKFFNIVKTGFSHKRKQLGSNLKEIVPESLFEKCGVNKTDRAEDLSLEQWICLTEEQ